MIVFASGGLGHFTLGARQVRATMMYGICPAAGVCSMPHAAPRSTPKEAKYGVDSAVPTARGDIAQGR